LEQTLPFLLQFDESLDVGSDTLTGVNDADCQPPFTFTGRINKITPASDRPKRTEAENKKLLEVRRSKKASEQRTRFPG